MTSEYLILSKYTKSGESAPSQFLSSNFINISKIWSSGDKNHLEAHFLQVKKLREKCLFARNFDFFFLCDFHDEFQPFMTLKHKISKIYFIFNKLIIFISYLKVFKLMMWKCWVDSGTLDVVYCM